MFYPGLPLAPKAMKVTGVNEEYWSDEHGVRQNIAYLVVCPMLCIAALDRI